MTDDARRLLDTLRADPGRALTVRDWGARTRVPALLRGYPPGRMMPTSADIAMRQLVAGGLVEEAGADAYGGRLYRLRVRAGEPSQTEAST